MRTPEQKAKWAAYMRAYNRAKTGSEGLGGDKPCVCCGAIFKLNTHTKLYCDACRRAKYLEGKRAEGRRAREKQKVVPVCGYCGAKFERTASRQIVCRPCKPQRDRDRTQKWQQENPGRVVQVRRAQYAKRRECGGKRLHGVVSSAVRMSLKGRKRASVETLLGFEMETLRAHLERQFDKRMSWANFGEWHIDHILPMALYPFETEHDDNFKLCWALTNLRPLWKAENLRKSSKRTLLL